MAGKYTAGGEKQELLPRAKTKYLICIHSTHNNNVRASLIHSAPVAKSSNNYCEYYITNIYIYIYYCL